MAKFNEKIMCLFQKDYKQLKKEAERRGMCHDGREKTIAKIIWKDAYDIGFNEGKEAAITAAPYCPANYYNSAKPEVHEYCFHDLRNETKYRLELTDEQVSAIEWMIDHDFITDVELSEWYDSFEDVGQI